MAFYESHARVEKIEGTHRRVTLATGAAFDTGVHGAIKAHYRLDNEKDLPLPVDYIVGATGAWMLGTLNGGLEARGVKLSGDMIVADVVGVNEVKDGLPVLASIAVHYQLRIPAGTRETVDRVLARHQEKCPTAATLRGAVEVTWTAAVTEV